MSVNVYFTEAHIFASDIIILNFIILKYTYEYITKFTCPSKNIIITLFWIATHSENRNLCVRIL